jgi:hypothetical protein
MSTNEHEINEKFGQRHPDFRIALIDASRDRIIPRPCSWSLWQDEVYLIVLTSPAYQGLARVLHAEPDEAWWECSWDGRSVRVPLDYLNHVLTNLPRDLVVAWPDDGVWSLDDKETRSMMEQVQHIRDARKTRPRAATAYANDVRSLDGPARCECEG